MLYGQKNRMLRFCKYELSCQLQEGSILRVVCALLVTLQQHLSAQQRDALQRIQAAENLRKQQEITTLQQPKYERLLIRAKYAGECARPDGTLDNYTVLCMSDHYEMVLVSGHP